MEHCFFLESVLVLTDRGDLFSLNPDELEFSENVCKVDRGLLKNNLISISQKIKIVNFRVLDSQERLLLYTQSEKMQKVLKFKQSSFFDKCYVVDLSERIPFQLALNAKGNSIFETTTGDFQADLVLSLDFPKKREDTINQLGFKIKISSFNAEKSGKMDHKFTIKGHYAAKEVQVENAQVLSSNITSMCLLYQLKSTPADLVLISEFNGTVHLFELQEREEKNKKNHYLVPRDQYLFLTKQISEKSEMILKNDYVEQTIKSFDQKHVILRTALSKVLVLGVDHSNQKLFEKMVIKDKFPFRHISLSSNGRFLLMGGIFLESIIKLDLSAIDEKSFCKDKIGFYELNKQFSEFKDIDEEGETLDNLKILKFGNFKDYSKFMEYVNKKKRRNDRAIRELEHNIKNQDARKRLQ